MKLKSALFTLFVLLTVFNGYSQSYELLINKSNKKTIRITENQNVRIAYPAYKIESGEKGNIGFRGKIDSIGKEHIYIKSRIKTAKPVQLSVKDIAAIKKSSSAGLIASLVGSYAIIGGGVIWAGNEADLNPTITTLMAGAAVFPSVLISTGLFYPSKPVRKVGEGYTLEIVETR